MYEKHFQLRERPFALSPDPEYLYLSKVHQEAMSYLRYGIEGHAGFVVITGEIGSGKTTMLQSLLRRLDPGTAVARIVNTLLDPRELLDAIMLDFGIDPTGMSKPMLLHELAAFLVQQRQASRLTLLVIDEAQNLGLGALEEVRMLSNLETEKSKLLQIVMIGQPELRETLTQPKLEQLRQRITVSYHLQPLDVDETAKYVNHRLRRAAIGVPMEFPRAVTDLIHGRSRGVPRIINVIGDATLLIAYGADRRDIDIDITQEALAELDATGVLASYGGARVRRGDGATVLVRGADGAEGATVPVRGADGAEGATVLVRGANGAEGATVPAPDPVKVQDAVKMPAPATAPEPVVAPAPEPPQATAPAARAYTPPPNRILAPSHRRTLAPSHYTIAPPHDRTVAPAIARPQRYAPVPVRHVGFWNRLRRAVFGAFEIGA